MTEIDVHTLPDFSRRHLAHSVVRDVSYCPRCVSAKAETHLAVQTPPRTLDETLNGSNHGSPRDTSPEMYLDPCLDESTSLTILLYLELCYMGLSSADPCTGIRSWRPCLTHVPVGPQVPLTVPAVIERRTPVLTRSLTQTLSLARCHSESFLPVSAGILAIKAGSVLSFCMASCIKAICPFINAISSWSYMVSETSQVASSPQRVM